MGGRRNRQRRRQERRLQERRMPSSPPDQQPPGQVRTVATFEQSFSAFSGPLPPPEVLQKYGDALASAPDRIIAMAERQAAHRHALEAFVVRGNVIREYIGQITAGIICLSGIGGGVFLLYNGKGLEGYATMLTPIIGVVTAWVMGRKQQGKELGEKKPALPPAKP